MTDDTECWGCGQDLLTLTLYPRQPYGDGPASEQDRWLCEVCESSFVVSKAGAGFPFSAEARDVLVVGHLVLAEFRGLTPRRAEP
jgi:hypothetical protein